MELTHDLSADALADALPGRAVRSYPAVLSTGADALAWARSGAPSGALVVADYQASPRGRAGLEWNVQPGIGLCFSLILRPRLSAEREGWLYAVATSGAADAVGQGATIEWPDEVRVRGELSAAIGIEVELGAQGTEWAVVNVLVPQAAPPRAPLLARLVEAIETRQGTVPADVLADYLPRCETIGRRVTARLIPMGPGGVEISGRAVGALMDGALLIETVGARRIAVRPGHLGRLEYPV